MISKRNDKNTTTFTSHSCHIVCGLCLKNITNEMKRRRGGRYSSTDIHDVEEERLRDAQQAGPYGHYQQSQATEHVDRQV